jgi:hypothetical protein
MILFELSLQQQPPYINDNDNNNNKKNVNKIKKGDKSFFKEIDTFKEDKFSTAATTTTLTEKIKKEVTHPFVFLFLFSIIYF